MSDQSYSSRLEALRSASQVARRRGWSYLVALVPLAALLADRVIHGRPGFIAAAAAVTGAIFWHAAAGRAATDRRELLDELILNGWRNVAPDEVDARERELLARRNRKILARALENQVSQMPLVLSIAQGAITTELRRNRREIHRLATKLRSLEQVDPRGVVVVEHLIRDGASPLHAGPSDQIAPALARAERMLERAA